MESLVEAALESFDARPAAAADELLAEYDRRFP
jgi:hypothetical protein